jgi:two-component system LytT family response regulator
MYTKALFVRRRSEFERVNIAAIQYVQKIQNDCIIVTAEKKIAVLASSLTALEELLGPSGFCRVHNSFMVSLDHVDKVAYGQVFVKGNKIPVGEVYAKSFYGQLMRLPEVEIKPRKEPAWVAPSRKKRELK